MKGQVDQVVDVDKLGAGQGKLKELGDKAKDLDIEKLVVQAQQKLKELGDKAKDLDVKQLGAQGKRRSRNSVRHQAAVRPRRTAPAASAHRRGPREAHREALDKAKAHNEPRQQP